LPIGKGREFDRDCVETIQGLFRCAGRPGYIEEQNLVVFRFSDRQGLENYETLGQELVEAAPDVIFVAGGDVVAALRPFVPTTPIVSITNSHADSSVVWRARTATLRALASTRAWKSGASGFPS
jgi:hypothetical protein